MYTYVADATICGMTVVGYVTKGLSLATALKLARTGYGLCVIMMAGRVVVMYDNPTLEECMAYF